MPLSCWLLQQLLHLTWNGFLNHRSAFADSSSGEHSTLRTGPLHRLTSRDYAAIPHPSSRPAVAANSTVRENHLQVYGSSPILFRPIGIDMQIAVDVNEICPEMQPRRPRSSRPT